MSRQDRPRMPYLVETPHGWKDMAFWRYVPRKPFMFVSGVFISVIIYREWKFVGTSPGMGVINQSMDDKTVVITGATSGVGQRAVKLMAKRGARIIMAVRDVDKCSEMRRELIHSAGNTQIFCRYLDMGSMESVRKFVSKINEQEEKVTTLVNCAGVSTGHKPDKRLTKDGIELHMGVNHFGPFLLTNLLAHKLSESSRAGGLPSHIINVLCHAHEDGELNLYDMNADERYDPRQAYNNSQLARVLTNYELSRRMLDKNVKVINLGFPRMDSPLHRERPYRRYLLLKVLAFPYTFWTMMDPGMAALSVVAAIVGHFDAHHGAYMSAFGEREYDREKVHDLDAMKLWKLSEKWVRLPRHDYIADPHGAASGVDAEPGYAGARAMSTEHQQQHAQHQQEEEMRRKEKERRVRAEHHRQEVAAEAAAVATHL